MKCRGENIQRPIVLESISLCQLPNASLSNQSILAKVLTNLALVAYILAYCIIIQNTEAYCKKCTLQSVFALFFQWYCNVVTLALAMIKIMQNRKLNTFFLELVKVKSRGISDLIQYCLGLSKFKGPIFETFWKLLRSLGTCLFSEQFRQPKYPMGTLSTHVKFQLSSCSQLGVMAILILTFAMSISDNECLITPSWEKLQSWNFTGVLRVPIGYFGTKKLRFTHWNSTFQKSCFNFYSRLSAPLISRAFEKKTTLLLLLLSVLIQYFEGEELAVVLFEFAKADLNIWSYIRSEWSSWSMTTQHKT